MSSYELVKVRFVHGGIYGNDMRLIANAVEYGVNVISLHPQPTAKGY